MGSPPSRPLPPSVGAKALDGAQVRHKHMHNICLANQKSGTKTRGSKKKDE